ncbi:MAG: hypothetical protein LUC33_00570 [Prevotellaceae bacterium]|nr:hypothetical protein [Prevotellaceae bacterium]
MDETMTIESVLRRLAERMNIGYLNETWARANLRLDKFRRMPDGAVVDEGAEHASLPCLLNVQNISGAFEYDSAGMRHERADLQLAFLDAMPLDFTGDTAQRIIDDLKRLAAVYLDCLRIGGKLEPLSDTMEYSATFDRLDANLCVLLVRLTVRTAVGVCIVADPPRTEDEGWRSI